MRVIETVAEMRAARRAMASPVGFVPTMGYLHAGHLSLARAARAECATVVASIFVNPTQFGPSEDLSRYPRDLPGDLDLLASAGVDLVFAPSTAEIYPAGFVTHVEPGGVVTERLEAASRPGHFRGVATVVTKLFGVVAPDVAYFGQKDAQQAVVVRRLVRDLDIPVEIVVAPTVREPDGLALSSRNAYLGTADRERAVALHRGLEAARAAVEAGEHDASAVLASARAAMEPFAVEPEYLALVDPETLEPLERVDREALVAVAARVGPARLIDN
ncbi:MAG TPA: pantoate--beta-alanine ligase, partial [Ktedonobacterales bacterium]|nr:pantoate--beta-alanine ligase [Ktedonobacterales bacterium]